MIERTEPFVASEKRVANKPEIQGNRVRFGHLLTSDLGQVEELTHDMT